VVTASPVIWAMVFSVGCDRRAGESTGRLIKQLRSKIRADSHRQFVVQLRTALSQTQAEGEPAPGWFPLIFAKTNRKSGEGFAYAASAQLASIYNNLAASMGAKKAKLPA
tara:strand:- start:127 stop:456 length:330 start_codon:yes stop_codon:yes gene_type:complete